jgi:hypothetical protein
MGRNPDRLNGVKTHRVNVGETPQGPRGEASKLQGSSKLQAQKLGGLEANLINTLLQRGVVQNCRHLNRFNGFHRLMKTVETVQRLQDLCITPLKQGVNEKAPRFCAG